MNWKKLYSRCDGNYPLLYIHDFRSLIQIVVLNIKNIASSTWINSYALDIIEKGFYNPKYFIEQSLF